MSGEKPIISAFRQDNVRSIVDIARQATQDTIDSEGATYHGSVESLGSDIGPPMEVNPLYIDKVARVCHPEAYPVNVGLHPGTSLNDNAAIPRIPTSLGRNETFGSNQAAHGSSDEVSNEKFSRAHLG